MYRDLNPYINNSYCRCIARFEDVNIITRGDVNLNDLCLKKLPHYKYVDGDFDCSNNHLTSLKGSPMYVGCSFNCTYNLLIYLRYRPLYVGEIFSWSAGNSRLNIIPQS